MSDIISYKLTDEVTDVEITGDYDPVQERNFEEYIHISENKNFGTKKLFNNMPNVETMNLNISGLYLNWGPGMCEKLKTLLTRTNNSKLNGRDIVKWKGRDNIENLYIYADTVLIDSYLHMPQSNVTIHARRLIFGEDGILDTSPLPFANPYAKGGNVDDGMEEGLNANSAGNINIFAGEIEICGRPSVKTDDKIKLCEPPLNENGARIVKPNFPENFCMERGNFEFELDTKDPGKIYFLFAGEKPKGGKINLDKTRNLKFEVKVKEKHETLKKIKVMLRSNGEIIIPEEFKDNCELSGPELEPNKPKYIGIYINKNDYEGKEVPVKEINYRVLYPYFILAGADGQHGEKGKLKDRKTSEKVPVSFDKFNNEVISHDAIIGTENDWIWPEQKELLKANRVYYTKSVIYSPSKWGDAVKVYEAGNSSIENMNNGLDACDSGNGGNGGNGGTLSIWNDKDFSGYYMVFSGGKGGTSEVIKGTKFPEGYDETNGDGPDMLHVNYYIRHKGIALPPVLDKLKSSLESIGLSGSFTDESIAEIDVDYIITKTLKRRAGKDGNGGKNGEDGEKGSFEQVRKEYYRWLHPNVLESVIQYCKDTFLTGDRNPAKWLIAIYLDSIKELNYTPEDFLKRNLINELSVINNKVSKNLDYFGHPIGWIPRLSASSNIDILKTSKASMVNVLYYAKKLIFENEASESREKQLAFMVEELKHENETARKKLQNGYNNLENVKIELDGINLKVQNYMSEIKNLQERVKTKLMREEQEQAIFSGLCEIAGAICQVIPYGQPFLGSIGGSIASTVSKINIYSDNPLGEAFKTTGGIATDLQKFIGDNKDTIVEQANSKIDKDIKSAEGQIGDVEKRIQSHKEDLDEFERIFGQKLELVNSKFELEKYKSEYLNGYDNGEEFLLEHFDELEMLKNGLGLESNFIGEIMNLKNTKPGLIKNLKNYQKAKKKQTKSIEKTGEVLEGIGKGIAGISSGLVNMMAPIEITEEEFYAKLNEARNAEFKNEFKRLKEKLDVFTTEKLKTAEKLFDLENEIESSCQTISSNLLKITAFNDERADSGQRQLNILTKQFLDRVTKQTQELLLAQIYYLVRSYQYKFVTKIESNLYNIPKLLEDINNFFTNKETKMPTKKDFEEAFDFVIQSEFLSLAFVLLAINMQSLPSITQGFYTISLNEESKNSDGTLILDELNSNGSVKFKLHELGVDNVGSTHDFYYRIQNISFTDIKVSFPEDVIEKNKDIADRITFKFGINHSGESVIRAADGMYYYFTSKAPETEANIIQNIKSWTADYNGDERDNENKGITNSKPTTEDHSIISKLIQEFGDKNIKLEYREHLPGATSELTLFKRKNNLPFIFKIMKLQFKVYYECIVATGGSLESVKQIDKGYVDKERSEKKKRLQKLINENQSKQK